VKGPLPFTIFNNVWHWQEEALAFHTNKKSRSDEKDNISSILGYKYPNEVSQKFSQWMMKHREFLETFHKLYKNNRFTLWIVGHKLNLEKIIAQEGFLVGFTVR
jgi:hypothetical protein